MAVQDRSRTAFEKPTAGATVGQPAGGRLADCWQASDLRGLDWVEAHLLPSPHTCLSFPLKEGQSLLISGHAKGMSSYSGGVPAVWADRHPRAQVAVR